MGTVPLIMTSSPSDDDACTGVAYATLCDDAQGNGIPGPINIPSPEKLTVDIVEKLLSAVSEAGPPDKRAVEMDYWRERFHA